MNEIRTRATSPDHHSGIPIPVLVLLALLSSLAPLSVDMYLPGFTRIASDLSASQSAVQLTLTTFLAGLAIGQLVVGPISDQYGRRLPLLISLVICTLAGVGTATTSSIEALIALRFVQGFCGSAGLVIGRSTVTDLTAGRAAIRSFSLLAAISGLGPILSPLFGGLLIPTIGWRGVLWVLAAYTLVMTICVAVVLTESLPVQSRIRGGINQTIRTGRELVRNRAYLSHLTVSFLAFGAIFAYVAASPFVLQDIYGLSTRVYSLAFATNAVALMLANLLNARLVTRIQPSRVLGWAQMAMVVVALGMTTIVVTDVATALTVCLSLFMMMFTIGLIVSNSSALAMVSVVRGTGTAAALIGTLQFGFGAVISPLVGLGGDDSAIMMVVCIAGCALLGLGAQIWSRHFPVLVADQPNQ